MADEEVKYQAFDGDVDDEESLLRQTQQARVRIVNLILDDPQAHKDLKTVDRLGSLLNDVDKQIISKRRVAAAQKNSEANQDLANALNSILMQRGNIKIRRHDEEIEETQGYQPPVPVIPDVEVTEGELAPVGEQIDVKSIMTAAFARPEQGEQD
ncbi:hypothetical protein SH780_000199 [Shigella flexneri]|nr:hypothetical protein [Shigella flexneri]